MSTDDSEWVKRLEKCHKSADGEMAKRYTEKLIKDARQRFPTLSYDDARDVVQKVFLGFLEKANSDPPQPPWGLSTPPPNLYNWLRTCVYNKAKDFFKKDKNVELHSDFEGNLEFPSLVNVEKEFFDELSRKEVRSLLPMLTESNRTLIERFFWEKQKDKKTAEFLNKKANTITQNRKRALDLCYVIYRYYFDLWTCEKIAKDTGKSCRGIKIQVLDAYKNYNKLCYLALDNLSEEDREIRRLRFTEGLSYQEIAEKMGMELIDVQNRFYDGQKKFHEELEEKGISEYLTEQIRKRKEIDNEEIFEY